MRTYFGKHDISETINAVAGIGILTIDVPFTPDYIKADFHGGIFVKNEDSVGNDEIFWNIVNVSPNQHQLTIVWNIFTSRKIFYRVARLIVDPV